MHILQYFLFALFRLLEITKFCLVLLLFCHNFNYRLTNFLIDQSIPFINGFVFLINRFSDSFD